MRASDRMVPINGFTRHRNTHTDQHPFALHSALLIRFDEHTGASQTLSRHPLR